MVGLEGEPLGAARPRGDDPGDHPGRREDALALRVVRLAADDDEGFTLPAVGESGLLGRCTLGGEVGEGGGRRGT